MHRWTRLIVRDRKKVLVAWVAALPVGGYASSGLSDPPTHRFSVPGSDAGKGLDGLKHD